MAAGVAGPPCSGPIDVAQSVLERPTQQMASPRCLLVQNQPSGVATAVERTAGGLALTRIEAGSRPFRGYDEQRRVSVPWRILYPRPGLRRTTKWDRPKT